MSTAARSVARLAFYARIVGCLAAFANSDANAAYLAFRQYDQAFGLTSSDGYCLSQDRGGNLLTCTDQGLFAFVGRRFVPLGVAQGLHQGGTVYDATNVSDGRVAVRYADDVYVTDRPIRSGQPTSEAFFRQPLGQPRPAYALRLHQLVAWQSGLAVVVNGLPVRIEVPSRGRARYEPIGYTPRESAEIGYADYVFAISDRLWVSTRDGRLCQADPGTVRCFGPADGLPAGPWFDVIAGATGTILARSRSTVATLDLPHRHITIETLPDQSGRYAGSERLMALFRDPDGHLLTQSSQGLLLRAGSGWRELNAEDGIPGGLITSALVDRSGQFWLQVIGHGLYRALGYGKWDTIPNGSGLTDGIPWQTARLRSGGRLLVTTDTGLMAVERQDHGFRITALTHDATFPLLVTTRDEVWSSVGQSGVRELDPVTGKNTVIASPAVNAILEGHDGAVWLATVEGLYKIDRSGDRPTTVALPDPRRPAFDLIDDGRGGFYYLSEYQLRHRYADGHEVGVAGDWPLSGFEPLAIARAGDGTMWVGGSGSLFRLTIDHDRIVSFASAPATETSVSSPNTLFIDHRGWLWTGTDSGVSVYDGHRWVSATTFDGLIWNDVSQGGLSEDTDGSIWISTSEGLSHLLDPAWLFARRAAGPVTTAMTLGARAIADGDRVPYSVEPLSVQFGISDFGAEQSIVFRYRLSGVNADWAESASGSVFYPALPAGRHVLSVAAFDTATELSSPMTTFVVSMAYPWWRQWWAEAGYVASAAAVIYAFYRLRLRRIFARQRQLERIVAERTSEILAAKAVLEQLATTDALTSLLNRGEAERRVAASLEALDRDGTLAVALVDIDHFKQVNDRYGHLGGDEVLRTAGRLAASSLVEDAEYACRIGGEEFLLVLDDRSGTADARIRAFHRQLRTTAMAFGDETISVTCSIGVARASVRDSWESLIGRADAALYSAKATGRNRIMVAPDQRHSDRAALVG